MKIIGLDPGPTESAIVIWDQDKIENAFQQPNDFILERLYGLRVMEPSARLIIEQIASFGMPVGAEVFETVYWSGRFAEAFGVSRVDRITRIQVKMALCHVANARDPHIRQALIDRYGKQGTKKAPGPLYGISNDLWSALAVAVAWKGSKCNPSLSIISTAPAELSSSPRKRRASAPAAARTALSGKRRSRRRKT